MPVPLSAAEGSPSHQRPAKKGRQRRGGATSHVIDVNSQLIEAISQEKVSVVRRLLSSGADPNTCSCHSTRDPALMLACSLPTSDSQHLLASLLLSSGARAEAENSSGETALMRGAMAGDARICSLLLGAGAAVGKEDCSGNTALTYAAENGNEEIVRLMVHSAKQQRCDIDHRNIRGLTALLIACQRGHLAAARILVQEGGASPTIRDLDNFTTAGEWMKRSGHYLESDLKFLFPVSRKKSYYRQHIQQRGIKTLSDYLSSESESNTSVFTARESTKSERFGDGSTKCSLSPPPIQRAGPTRSMFDIPSSNHFPAPPTLSSSSSSLSPFRKKSILPRLPSKPKPQISSSPDFKSDLYHSRYLKQRQVFVTPNRQSGGFHTGALQPIPGDHLDRISHSLVQQTKVEDGGREGQVGGGRGGKRGKHKSLPPL